MIKDPHLELGISIVFMYPVSFTFNKTMNMYQRQKLKNREHDICSAKR
jgi:alkyl hydroperoxide reductase subunit AhpC